MKTGALVLLCAIALNIGAAAPAALKLTQTIPLPGVKGRFDHCVIDAKGNRLFVAALGNNTLEVVDLTAGQPLKSITGLHKPAGVLYLAEQNQIAVANGDDGTFKLSMLCPSSCRRASAHSTTRTTCVSPRRRNRFTSATEMARWRSLTPRP